MIGRGNGRKAECLLTCMSAVLFMLLPTDASTGKKKPTDELLITTKAEYDRVKSDPNAPEAKGKKVFRVAPKDPEFAQKIGVIKWNQLVCWDGINKLDFSSCGLTDANIGPITADVPRMTIVLSGNKLTTFPYIDPRRTQGIAVRLNYNQIRAIPVRECYNILKGGGASDIKIGLDGNKIEFIVDEFRPVGDMGTLDMITFQGIDGALARYEDVTNERKKNDHNPYTEEEISKEYIGTGKSVSPTTTDTGYISAHEKRMSEKYLSGHMPVIYWEMGDIEPLVKKLQSDAPMTVEEVLGNGWLGKLPKYGSESLPGFKKVLDIIEKRKLLKGTSYITRLREGDVVKIVKAYLRDEKAKAEKKQPKDVTIDEEKEIPYNLRVCGMGAYNPFGHFLEFCVSEATGMTSPNIYGTIGEPILVDLPTGAKKIEQPRFRGSWKIDKLLAKDIYMAVSDDWWDRPELSMVFLYLLELHAKGGQEKLEFTDLITLVQGILLELAFDAFTAPYPDYLQEKLRYCVCENILKYTGFEVEDPKKLSDKMGVYGMRVIRSEGLKELKDQHVPELLSASILARMTKTRVAVVVALFLQHRKNFNRIPSTLTHKSKPITDENAYKLLNAECGFDAQAFFSQKSKQPADAPKSASPMVQGGEVSPASTRPPLPPPVPIKPEEDKAVKPHTSNGEEEPSTIKKVVKWLFILGACSVLVSLCIIGVLHFFYKGEQ